MASPGRSNGDLQPTTPADPIELTTNPLEHHNQQSRRRRENDEILGEAASSYPPTLGELEDLSPSPSGRSSKFLDPIMLSFLMLGGMASTFCEWWDKI